MRSRHNGSRATRRRSIGSLLALVITVSAAAGCTQDGGVANSASSTTPASNDTTGSTPSVSDGRSPSTNGGSTGQGRASTSPAASSGCVFSTKVTVAFCESFNSATPDPGTRSGDLDATVWGVSRTNTLTNWTQGQFNVFKTATLVGCGPDHSVTPPNDVRICDGRLHEAVADGTGQSTLAMYPKQPFDIADRTGTAVFDVSADSGGTHNAWPEFWWTDQPVPATHGHMASQAPYAKNSFGFDISGCDGDTTGTKTGVDKMMITRNSAFEAIPFTKVDCVEKGSSTGGLNHFEVRLSKTRAEVWASDPGSDDIRLIADADLDMPLTRGVIWIEDVHYNACKPGFGVPQCDHSFAWDNVGFDGPTPYRDLTFDVQDALTPGDGGVNLGYFVSTNPTKVVAKDVHWDKTPAKQFIAFNWFPWDATVPSLRVNGGPWHDTPWPFDDETFAWRTIAVPVPLDELRTGDNTIEFKYPNSTGTVVTNIDVILTDAASVP